jgi:hypothetical protein
MIEPESVSCVIYHDRCMDGFGAAWAAWHYNPEITFIPGVYGMPEPSFAPGEVVLCLDFSFPRSTLERLRKTISIGVIDHHATTAQDLEGMSDVIMDMEHSGAVLAWNYFFPKLAPPLMLRYIEDRDLWRFQLPYSQEVNAFLQSWPKSADFWEVGMATLGDDALEYAAQQGRACLQMKMRGLEAQLSGFSMRLLGDRLIPMVNSSLYFSELCSAYLEGHPSEPVAGYFFQRGDGKWQVGLRSQGDFHCGEFARAFGGGGHKTSAGFVLEKAP